MKLLQRYLTINGEFESKMQNLFIETYLYRVYIISSQAIFHMCPVVIFVYENKHSII